MRPAYIYAVTCLCHPEDGIRYIGQTVVSITSRKGVHLWNSRTQTSKSYNSHFSRWIRKHGEENVVFSCVEETTEDRVDEVEDHWITTLRDRGIRLTNVKGGGGQARGHKRPDLSERMRGSRNPMYGKDRSELMAYARSFQGPPSEETKKKWSENRRGSGNPRSVLTEDDVRELRKEPRRRGLFSEWARKLGVSVPAIASAYNGDTWKHLE